MFLDTHVHISVLLKNVLLLFQCVPEFDCEKFCKAKRRILKLTTSVPFLAKSPLPRAFVVQRFLSTKSKECSCVRQLPQGLCC
jgi:hypothetical protein